MTITAQSTAVCVSCTDREKSRNSLLEQKIFTRPFDMHYKSFIWRQQRQSQTGQCCHACSNSLHFDTLLTLLTNGTNKKKWIRRPKIAPMLSKSVRKHRANLALAAYTNKKILVTRLFVHENCRLWNLNLLYNLNDIFIMQNMRQSNALWLMLRWRSPD